MAIQQKDENISVLSHSDFWTGIVLVLIGGLAAWMATGFDAESWLYPMVLGVVLALCGAILAVQAAMSSRPSVSFTQPLLICGPAALVIAIWIMAIVWGWGFLLPTFVMQVALMKLGGMTGLRRPLSYASLVTVAGYGLFVWALGTRLPAPLYSWLI